MLVHLIRQWMSEASSLTISSYIHVDWPYLLSCLLCDAVTKVNPMSLLHKKSQEEENLPLIHVRIYNTRGLGICIVTAHINPHPVLWGLHGPRKDWNRHPTVKLSYDTGKLSGSMRPLHIQKREFFSIFIWGLKKYDTCGQKLPRSWQYISFKTIFFFHSSNKKDCQILFFGWDWYERDVDERGNDFHQSYNMINKTWWKA